MDSSLKVSVSGKDSGCNHIVVDNVVLDNIGDITRVSNAGHASISSSAETKFFKVGLNSSFFEVLSDDMRSGGKRALDVRSDSQAFLNGVTGKHTSLEHNIGVGGVGARGDSSNDKRSLVHLVVFSFVVNNSRLLHLFFLESETLEADFVLHAVMEILLHGAEGNSIVRSLGSRKARNNRSKV